MAVAFAAGVGLMGEAQAEEWSRKLELKWVLQKADRDSSERSWVASIPNAFINRLENSDNGGRYVGLTYDDGTHCSSVGSARRESIMLSCGSMRGNYVLTAEPGQPLQLSWTTQDPSVGVGHK
jgi:hypothetical protein